MVKPSKSKALKPLNKAPRIKRFAFKNFSQRIEEIDIDVFRSLDQIKSEPSNDSSFLRDCLVEWRELNTSEDFISFYQEMMPWVQTLPQVLLHKETIMSKLLSRLDMKAKLSLEPILRLISALSRDLLEDFLPYLQRIINSLVGLLKKGADREPEVIEQIFTSWSSIMMYLQKYLIRDIVHVLKITVRLRYYPKDYVQEFMAKSISFLLRNAHVEQLIKGVKKTIFEVAKKPSDVRKYGASALLWHVMRGTSSRFHSRAEQVLRLLMDNSILGIGDRFTKGSDTVVEVVTVTFQILCKEREPKELNLMWDSLFGEIFGCLDNGSLLHLNHLLSILISTYQFSNGGKLSDYQPMLGLARSLIQKFITPGSMKPDDHTYELVDKVLQLMLCLIDVLLCSGDALAIESISSQWGPVFEATIFELRNTSLLTFIKELLLKDPCVTYAFRSHMLSALNYLLDTSPSSEEVIYLMLTFYEKLQGKMPSSYCLDGMSEEKVSKIRSFFQESIAAAINDIAYDDPSSMCFSESKLAVLWGVICCYPHVLDVQANPSSIMDLVDALDLLPIIEAEKVAGVPKGMWQSLVGATLDSYTKLHSDERPGLAMTKRFLDLAQKYKSSSQVLFAVAEFLDSVHGSTCEADTRHKTFHPELEAEKAIKAIHVFADNLHLPDKMIRVSTLRILCHYEPLDQLLSTSDQPTEKKLKTEACQPSKMDTDCNNVIQLLLSIEVTPLSVSTSRTVNLLISRIKMGLSASRISEVYVPLLLNGIIGIFHRRFSDIWEPALECLAILIDKYVDLVWDRFVQYFEHFQSEFLTSGKQLERVETESSSISSDLVECFNAFVSPDSDCTSSTIALSLLLQCLQKVLTISESRNRQLIRLFLNFLGYANDDFVSVGSFNSHSCNGKKWRVVLKEWLNLLKLMRNPKSLYRSQILHEVLTIRLLDENDAHIQLKVLDCLLNWKDDFLLPYGQQLKNLITSKKLREELATWTLSKESHHIQEQHREQLIPIVVRLLIPKVRKLKTLASRKHASVQHRRAILCFLAQLDVNELPIFFSLLIKPLQPVSNGSEDFSKCWNSFEDSTEGFQASGVAKIFTVDHMTEISWKKRYGFLHVIEDIFKSFDEFHVRPFLNLLMGFVVRILASCTLSLESTRSNGTSQLDNLSSGDLTIHEVIGANPMTSTAVKQFKDQRSLCLNIISLVLNKYEDHDFGCTFWDLFFTSVKPLIDGFKQEGSSSEKPSSLFSCFLVMSRSQKLVSLLNREESLVPTIFSILTVKKVSNAVTVSVLSFIENLLNLDNDLDNHEDLGIKRVVLSNLGALIDSLHSFYHCDNVTQRKSHVRPGKMELRIFKLLSKHISDHLAARQFLDIVLPLLGKKTQNSDECLEVLHVIQGILPELGSGITGKILNALGPLLISAGLDVRLSVCNLLDTLTVNDPSVASLAKLVRELNAICVSEIDELDYDTIVDAYAKFDKEFFSKVREDHALVILSQSVYNMSSEELILRQSAYSLFLSFLQFSALILDSEAGIILEVGPWWTKSCIQRIIKKLFLKHMGEAMKKEISIQREWISLLREMVWTLPNIPALNSLRGLCSEDAEVDFFNNILHLQKHRRARALVRFRSVIGAGNFSEFLTKKVFVPLFFKMMLDVQEGKGEHIRDACVESLATITGHMQWESYHAFLMRCFRVMTLKRDKQKVLLRLICSVLDQFHFIGVSMNQEPHDTICDVSNSDAIGMSTSTTLRKCTNSAYSIEIQTCLKKSVLPKIQKLLDADSEKVNVTINLAALKLLKLLPMDTLESQLPSIIHRISNFLKNRMESIRDEARSALAACSKVLGLEYLQFILKVLRATLKRGYELHVLGYTLNFILSKALPSPATTGKLDYCLEELLSVAENDILGDVSEEKDVEKIASKMKETRKSKSFETLKLIAQSITFKTHALKLLSPVKTHLQKHLTPKIKAKLNKMLTHIATGIECNPSVDQTDLLIFVYGLIEDGIAEETVQNKDSIIAKPNKKFSNGVTVKRNSLSQVISYQSQSSHLITVFALGILQNRLKNMKLNKKDEQLLSMLDPFVKLLGNCLSSKYEDILSASLRCLAPLLRLPLPSLESLADKIKTLLLDITQKSGNNSSPLVQSCLKLLTVLLRSTEITLAKDELQMLIQFPFFVDLERNPSFIALLLLKAFVVKKVVALEIYDLVTRVAELMVTSQMEHIRKECSKILLQFLLGYQLSGERLQQHLDFLLANLSYEQSTGREAVLEMFHAIIIKFPKSIVDQQAQTLFLHLVVCLANDKDNKVRSMVGAAIKLLIRRTSQHSLLPILEYSLSWYMGKKQNLWCAAAQVLGLLVEVLKKDFQKHNNNVLLVAKNILTSSLDVINERPDYSNEAMIPFWKEAYYSLVMLEKIFLQFPELYLEKDHEDIWEAICELLLHPHMWLRTISSRLVESYFAEISKPRKENSEKLKSETSLLMKPSKLFAIAVSFCCQLRAQLTDDATCNLITKNLSFTICNLHSLAGQREGMDPREFWSSLELQEQDHFVKAFQLLGSSKGRSILAYLTGGVNGQNDQEIVEDLQSLLVSPLLKRMGKVALQMEDNQMKIVFNCFDEISSKIGKEGCEYYAIHMLLPLYKVCEGFAGKIVADDVKQLAEEVRAHIQKILGTEKFVKMYTEIRKNLKAKRDKRKQEEKVMAVVNPMRNAKRKLRVSQKNRANKKRKIMTLKMGRWNGSRSYPSKKHL